MHLTKVSENAGTKGLKCPKKLFMSSEHMKNQYLDIVHCPKAIHVWYILLLKCSIGYKEGLVPEKKAQVWTPSTRPLIDQSLSKLPENFLNMSYSL